MNPYPLRSCRFRHPTLVPDVCRLCKHYAILVLREVAIAQPADPPIGTPGAELAAILASLGITSEKGCGCAQKAAQMNALGIEGCIAHRDEIADWLREQSQRLGWAEKLQAAARAIWQGLILDPLDPAPGLVAEAIRRAQAKTSLLTTTGEFHAKRE